MTPTATKPKTVRRSKSATKKNTGVRKPTPVPPSETIAPYSAVYKTDPIQEAHDFAVAVIEEREQEIKELREKISEAEKDISLRQAQVKALKPHLRRTAS